MSKIKIVVIIVFAAIFVSGGYFYWEELRGIGPAIKPPPEDIGDAIENQTGISLHLPDGFSISIFAENLGDPRDLIFGPGGDLWVSVPKKGKIVSLADKNGDGSAEDIRTLIDDLDKPHGVTYECYEEGSCHVYIAQENALLRYDYDIEKNMIINKKVVLNLPSGGNHTTRSLLFMPYPNEHMLLVSVGSSCNVCHEEDKRRAAILFYNIKTGESGEYARGLRNSVFMEIHPVTGDIWATEMGRDFLGDDLPPDEINIIRKDVNYGWPVCYGKNIHDTDFDKNTYIRNPCTEPFEASSFIDVPAHSAPLGLSFIPEEGWPEEWWYDLIVAFHGSWNKSEPTGYKLYRYKLDAEGNYEGEEDFITGWLVEDGALGRPADVLILPGGVMFVSDDKAGVVYRITRS